MPHGRVLTFRDVTERRRAAEALHRLNASLELRIEERTKALRASTELAQAASRAKSEFLSNMSHEIRTPLHAVIGMTGLALGSESPVQQRSYLEKIQSSGQHLLNLVNDILDFSKIEAGRMDIERQPFDLRECVESAMDLIGARAAENARHAARLIKRIAAATTNATMSVCPFMGITRRSPAPCHRRTPATRRRRRGPACRRT